MNPRGQPNILNNPDQYDFIIAGAGCAGLSLAMHMIASGKFSQCKVLIIDKEKKDRNDRTWCFWEKASGLFQPVVYKEWQEVSFFSGKYGKTFNTTPYTYKMIRGADFYQYSLTTISKHSNFSFINGEITHIFSNEEGATGVKLSEGRTIYAGKVFSSILPQAPGIKQHIWLLQHFKGWLIESASDVFRTEAATLMDFRTSQEHGATFCYVLPFSKKTALVEYTIFSADVIEQQEYDRKLKEYVEQTLSIREYTVHETEYGVIPMTDYRFPEREKDIYYIGTAGGQTKGSSGYTFQFIQKHSQQLVAGLLGEKHNHVKKRHLFYDSVLLGVLQRGQVSGEEIFRRMFGQNKIQTIFRFLDNESSLAEEINVIRSLPVLPFLKSALKKL